jgi:hypothetical protein
VRGCNRGNGCVRIDRWREIRRDGTRGPPRIGPGKPVSQAWLCYMRTVVTELIIAALACHGSRCAAT